MTSTKNIATKTIQVMVENSSKKIWRKNGRHFSLKGYENGQPRYSFEEREYYERYYFSTPKAFKNISAAGMDDDFGYYKIDKVATSYKAEGVTLIRVIYRCGEDGNSRSFLLARKAK